VFFKRRLPFSSKLSATLSVVCALIAFLMVRGIELRAAGSDRRSGPPSNVVVATKAIRRGTAIDPSMVALEEVPAAFAPAGAIRSLPLAQGRILMADIDAGEVVTRSRLTPTSSGPVAELVPAGLRAVEVAAAVMPGDLIPGDRVDLLAAFEGAAGRTESVGSGLQVLRVDEVGESPDLPIRVAGSSSMPRTALLLLVDPSEAERIAFAQAFGALSVAIDPVTSAEATP
jgi:pilus assembly protein CpaB